MKQESMTALTCLFSRAYHNQTNSVPVLRDSIARKLISDEEFRSISESMADGVSFFFPGYTGDRNKALQKIVDEQLSPSPLGRTVFTENALRRAVADGCSQYLMLASGYDTFAYRQPQWAKKLKIFELDTEYVVKEKAMRVERAGLSHPENLSTVVGDVTQSRWISALLEQGFSTETNSLCSILGLVYYLTKPDFSALLCRLSKLLCTGSLLVFDYPDENAFGVLAGERAKKQSALAMGAGEPMVCGYDRQSIGETLEEHGFHIETNLSPDQITNSVFKHYNKCHPDRRLSAFDNTNFCICSKK